jgi:hypothetical protein
MIVIPAKAGTHLRMLPVQPGPGMGPRLRGGDEGLFGGSMCR